MVLSLFVAIIMSGVKPITSYFKVITKDQLELSELQLDTQSSRNYRTLSLQTAITNTTLSTKVYDAYVDLTKADDLPAQEDFVNVEEDDVVAIDDNDDTVVEVEGLGDSIFSALDSVLGPTPLVFSNTQPASNKKRSRSYNNRPDNWSEIADYYRLHRTVSGTIFHFKLHVDKGEKTRSYWTTTFGRWMKDAAKQKWTCSRGQVPVYGTKIDQQLLRVVENYSEHAVPITNLMLRHHLLTFLEADERKDILDAIAMPEEPLTNTKKYRFSDQWALRFYRRHNLSTRVATTKICSV